MKHFHGRRHIRARRSVITGRLKRFERKVNRISTNFRMVSKAAAESVKYSEEFAKSFGVLASTFYIGVAANSDGTYTHTWNFEKKG